MNVENKIKTKLIELLRDAAEIEQQFMCMYLYGALSMKKRYSDQQSFEHINAAQLEETRRWLSTVYLVARQEMEHLALANNLLRAIGGAPYFAHANVGQGAISKYFTGAESEPKGQSCCDDCAQLEPIPHEFELSQFDLAAAKKWTCMEAPSCTALKTDDAEHFASWCFACKPEKVQQTPYRQVMQKALDEDNIDAIAPGDIASLYDCIEGLFELLPASAYVTAADQQVSITQQYDIYVYPVTNLASAKQAIDLIIKQGEGRQASSTYLSHYRRFYDISESLAVAGTDMQQEKFTPYWPLITNPTGSEITEKTTRELFHLFNHAYETLLLMLTSLYALPEQNPQSYPHFAPSLGQEAFAPSMTMIIRSLGELLVQLKADSNNRRVGPGFIISDEIDDLLRNPYCAGSGSEAAQVSKGYAGSQLKPELANIDSIINRFTDFNSKLAVIVNEENLPVADQDLQAWAQSRIEYIYGNSSRIEVNIRRIYQQGVFSPLQSESY